MKWSKAFIPTVKEDPSDAEVVSHKLMVRAGLMRKLAAGAYSYLPLGYRTLRKIEQIIRREMEAVGALELHMPVIQPGELWERTGRLKAYGPVLMNFTDRHGRRVVLGPTHEEVITTLVADNISSYKQLPLNLYQIQTKFRDEYRPRFGVLRTREFLMKDAYSFHLTIEDLKVTYEKMYQAYCRIFDRCGLDYVIVEAESGPIGGESSHEFMVPTEAGEDTLVRCSCGYAANLERATAATPKTEPKESPKDLRQVHTPGATTIDELTKMLNTPAEQLIKTLVLVGDGKPLAALVRGDHELNEAKLAHAAGVSNVQMADAQTIEKLTGAAVGFAGPVGLSDLPIIADKAVQGMVNAATGANKTDYHLLGVNPGRDFTPSTVADIRLAAPGDRCAKCNGELKFSKGIEVGHVFQPGAKYSDALGAQVLNEKGKNQPVLMGTYGIGLNRIMAAAIETRADEQGIIWPMSIAPFQVILVQLGQSDQVLATAEKLYEDLTARGCEVLWDDRDARPGVKFNDADLIGIPLRITIGEKALAKGNVELKPRTEKQPQLLEPAAAVDTVMRLINS
ncbi:MAG: proline--tRNA ligase [Phycisphaerae bacterium]|nr:proline--tRNA ligase [Phycisphaerae bacterium]